MKKNILSLAVHLHLHYLDMWHGIKGFLGNMRDYPYDLFVTMTLENLGVIEDIRSFCPGAKIWIVENRGYDVGPFIDFLHKIDLDNYDLVMKIHTKNTAKGLNTHINKYIFTRKLWFETLINALVGSYRQFSLNISKFKNISKLGMIGSKYLITSDSKYSAMVKDDVERILSEWGYKNEVIKFVAGTMFICRSKLLKPFKEHYRLTDFEITKSDVKDGTLSHVLERMFGVVVVAKGYEIAGFDRKHLCMWYAVWQNIKRFVYQHKITKKNNELIKIFKLPIYHRKRLS